MEISSTVEIELLPCLVAPATLLPYNASDKLQIGLLLPLPLNITVSHVIRPASTGSGVAAQCDETGASE